MYVNDTRSVRRVATLTLGFALASTGLAGCGGGSSSSGTTLAPLTSTNFVTTPPIESTTIDPANTVPPAREYTVQAGDYLFGIAKAFGLDASEIANYNGWPEGLDHAINPGDVIKIPPGGVTPTTVDPTLTPVTAAPPVSTVPPGQGTYTVVAGDFLFGIAKKFGTTAEAIAQANGWADGVNHNINPGDVINIPAKST